MSRRGAALPHPRCALSVLHYRRLIRGADEDRLADGDRLVVEDWLAVQGSMA